MSKLVVVVFCTLVLNTLSAQEPEVIEITEESSEVPFAIVDEVPIYPGCEDKDDKRKCFQEMMQQHVSQHFRYPEEAQKQKIQGRVSAIFTIDLDGSITAMRTRGTHPILEEETQRIFSLLPKMKPGMHSGKPVRVPFSIPLTFKLQ